MFAEEARKKKPQSKEREREENVCSHEIIGDGAGNTNKEKNDLKNAR